MIEFLERIRGKRRASVQSAKDRYDQLVIDVLGGKPVSEESFTEILEAAGKSDDDFEAAMKRREQRLQAVADIAAFESGQGEIIDANEAMAAAKLEHSETVRIATEKLDAVQLAWSRARERKMSLHARSQKARKILEDTACPILKRQERVLLEQRRDLVANVDTLTTYTRQVKDDHDARARLLRAQQALQKNEVELTSVQRRLFEP